MKANHLRLPVNLLADLPARPEPNERFETLLTQPGVRIERIISTGQASPAGFWYDQAQAEWVLLIQGSAVLKFEDEQVQGEVREEIVKTLTPGDHLYIAPHRRHRVEFTQADPPTVWLAIHIAHDSNRAGLDAAQRRFVHQWRQSSLGLNQKPKQSQKPKQRPIIQPIGRS